MSEIKVNNAHSYIAANYNGTSTLNKFHLSNAFVRGLQGCYGCLPYDTEYLSEFGWKRMVDYRGEQIHQWNPLTNNIELVDPLDYIVAPCSEFIRISNRYSMDMVLSSEHRVVYYDWRDNLQERTADYIYSKFLTRKEGPSFKIPVTFRKPFVLSSLPFTEDELRLMVAIQADGCLPKGSKQCVITLRKSRKKRRLEKLLTRCKIEYSVSFRCDNANESIYTFIPPERNKFFDSRYWGATQYELEVIFDEVFHWDGTLKNGEKIYFSTDKGNADFIQYVCHATGHRASINIPKKTKIRDIENGWKHCYRVNVTNKLDERSNLRMSKASLVPSEDGLKYCFVVPSSYFVVRHNDRIFITGNSAKSTACCMEILHRGLTMPVFPGTNERRSKWAIIRATYPELHGTVLETWKKILPLRCLELKLGNREQPSVTVDFMHHDGSRINIRMQLFALDNPKLVDKLGSYEYTGAWINEAREIPLEIFNALTGRVGRYPGKIIKYDKDGNIELDENGNDIEVEYWTGIIMDTNPPDIDHWWYRLAEEKRPKNYEFFKQPPALLKNRKSGEWIPNPNAENINNLPGGYKYYFNQIGGKDEAWIRVYVQGRYGTLSAGKPVFPMYDDNEHYDPSQIRAFKIYPGVPILAGVDYGFNSAVVFAQLVPGGQLRVIDEIFVDNITTRDFIIEHVKPYLANNFSGMEIEWWGDPAGDTRSSTSGGTGAMEYINQGINMRPAPTNLINPRIQSVATFLKRKNGFKMSSKCKILRMGFQGEYCFERVMVSQERFRDKPTKNHKSSHCFVGKTLVNTPKGMIKIEDLQVGDYVYTPNGTQKITATMSSLVQETIELIFSNGVKIECTKNHSFFTEQGVVLAQDLQYIDVIESINNTKRSKLCHIKQFIPFKSLTELNFIKTLEDIIVNVIKKVEKFVICIGAFGNIIMVKSQKAWLFITKTAINQTTLLIISNLCKEESIRYTTTTQQQIKEKNKYWKTFLSPHIQLQKNGMEARTDWNGIANMEKKHGKIEALKQLFVKYAVKKKKHILKQEIDFVHHIVRQKPEGFLGLMILCVNVLFVKPSLKLINILKQKHVVRLVGKRQLAKPKRVYNVTVENEHVFYVSGLLVANCHDALQYIALSADPTYTTKRFSKTKIKDAPMRWGA